MGQDHTICSVLCCIPPPTSNSLVHIRAAMKRKWRVLLPLVPFSSGPGLCRTPSFLKHLGLSVFFFVPPAPSPNAAGAVFSQGARHPIDNPLARCATRRVKGIAVVPKCAQFARFNDSDRPSPQNTTRLGFERRLQSLGWLCPSTSEGGAGPSPLPCNIRVWSECHSDGMPREPT